MQIPTHKKTLPKQTHPKPGTKSTNQSRRAHRRKTRLKTLFELLLMRSFPRWCHRDPGIKASACNPKTRCRESIQRRKCARKRRERTLSFNGDQEVEETEENRARRGFLRTLGTNAKGSTSSAPDPAVSAIAPPSVLAKCLATNNKWNTHNTFLLLFLSLSLSSLSVCFFGFHSSVLDVCHPRMRLRASVWPRLSSSLTRDGSRGMV